MKPFLAMVFSFAMGLAAFAADPMARLSVYNREIANKPAGVYEIKGDVYVQARVVRSVNSDNDMFAAEQQAEILLKEWLNKQAKHGKNPIMKVVKGQQVVRYAKGELIVGRIYSRNDLFNPIKAKKSIWLWPF